MSAAGCAGRVTLLFTDIEGSTRLWDAEPRRMPAALARHDALARLAVTSHGGIVVKMIGDGMHAVFDDPIDAVRAALHFELALSDPAATEGIALRVRCGMHTGDVERRDNDYFGTAVNRAARIMSAAHGGQVLLSEAVAAAVTSRLPDGVALRDLGSARLRDLSTPERLYQLVHARLRSEFPALRSLEATPNNLPQQVTSFVGNERGLADVKRLLGETPLLTLVGMGGLGKSRLSLQVAADVLDDYADGAWLVELAPVADPRLVPQAVASVLGVVEEAGRPVLEALLRYVRDRELLLIIDNCEHLAGACAELAKRLMDEGPRLTLLASSREPLRVPGERTYPVPALTSPAQGEHSGPDSLMRYEAARLFVDRARLVQPSFGPTERNAGNIAEICRRLDGIPLAIELAAARVRTMPVDRIAERLADRFRLLTRGSRTALPRQQTLRALIDWSHDLLEPAEKRVFARLSVFAGGFVLDAAESVAAGDGIAPEDVLDVVSGLVDKSLIELDAAGGRYRMLETVREYAMEKLDGSADGVAARARHVAYYLAFAEQAQPELWGAEQGRWLARLDVELENLLSALAWCDDVPNGPECGLRLADALQLYWLPRGMLELGYRMTQQALARDGAQCRDRHRSGALYAASQIAYFLGAYANARGHAEECVAIAGELGHETRRSAGLLVLGYACEGLGDEARAIAHFETSAGIARTLGESLRLSFALNALAGARHSGGDLEAAERLFEEALALARAMNDRETIAIGLPNLARVLIERGANERARSLLVEGLGVASEIGSPRAVLNVVEVVSGLASRYDAWMTAARLLGAVETQTKQLGMKRPPSDEAPLSALLERVRSALGPEAFDAAEAEGRALNAEGMVDETRSWLQSGG